MQQARAAGMLQIEALASERGGRLHAATGDPELERYYLRRAARLYRQWGAHAKVAQLEHELGDTGGAPNTRLSSTSESTGADGDALQQLDFGSVMKSLHTLSGVIQLDALLTRIMDLVIENAGAQHGVLVLDHDGEMFVEAERTVGDVVLARAATQPLDESTHVPR